MSDADTYLSKIDHSNYLTLTEEATGLMLYRCKRVTKPNGTTEKVGMTLTLDNDEARALLSALIRRYPIDSLGKLIEERPCEGCGKPTLKRCTNPFTIGSNCDHPLCEDCHHVPHEWGGYDHVPRA